jgi:CheY-like chemotaxis protein
MGHSVEAVGDGLEALGALDRDTYDLVMMDIVMPRLDGLGAAQMIRTRWAEQRRIPIVAVTGQSGPDIYRRCITRGMDDCLVKPITLEALERSLARIASHAGAQPQ